MQPSDRPRSRSLRARGGESTASPSARRGATVSPSKAPPDDDEFVTRRKRAAQWREPEAARASDDSVAPTVNSPSYSLGQLESARGALFIRPVMHSEPSSFAPLAPVVPDDAAASSVRPLALSSADSAPSLMDRRRFISKGARALAAALLAHQALQWTERVEAGEAPAVFTYGVASGDPLPTRVIIWTRVNPSAEATPGSGLGAPVRGVWEVALDAAFTQRVTSGRFTSSVERDHTIKIDVAGLSPDTEYYYRFYAIGAYSPIGRTRTAPSDKQSPSHLRFGLLSCSNYEAGYFSAYRHLSQRSDLHFVLHVGDYIYEYATGEYADPAVLQRGRVHVPTNEIVSLADYRRRHALHKADPDSQSLHQRYAFITTWDDHEVANDAWRDGAQNHTDKTEGSYLVRRDRAYQAYLEWMPIRLPDGANQTRIYRNFRFGTLADLYMLDLRQYRDKQATNGAVASTTEPGVRAIDEDARRFPGQEQLTWIKSNLSGSTAQWRLLGNSVMITPVDFSNPAFPAAILQQLGLFPTVPFNVDSWDGYRSDRAEILSHLAGNPVAGNPTTPVISNTVFLTGDIHSSWACDVPRDAAAYHLGMSPSVAVEFVGPSVTSDNLNELLGVPPRSATTLQVEAAFKGSNQQVKLLEFDSHGYAVVDVDPQRVQVDWFYVSDRTDPLATVAYSASMQALSGWNRVQVATGPLS